MLSFCPITGLWPAIQPQSPCPKKKLTWSCYHWTLYSKVSYEVCCQPLIGNLYIKFIENKGLYFRYVLVYSTDYSCCLWCRCSRCIYYEWSQIRACTLPPSGFSLEMSLVSVMTQLLRHTLAQRNITCQSTHYVEAVLILACHFTCKF